MSYVYGSMLVLGSVIAVVAYAKAFWQMRKYNPIGKW